MEDHHATSWFLFSPPPRPLKPTRLLLTHLWQALPQANRHQTLLTLSRIVARQLPKPPADKEADHEPS
jgi:hypothetical protein